MKQMNNQSRQHLSRLFMMMLISLSLLLLAGCGGGSSSADSASSDGEVYVSLTDAEGDFSSYTVDVTSITLVKANGTVVETLPISSRVDFAQYVEMTEFLTVSTIPSGRYVKGTLTIDYSNADIWVEDATGLPVKVKADNLLDEAGNPVTTLELSVRLEDHNSLLIIPGVPSHLTLDFDLNASHQTIFDGADPVTTVKPVLVADVELEKSKSQRLRGPLKGVNLADSSYQILLRPFHHPVRRDNTGRFGTLNIKTNRETIFQIDGESYRGEAGLQILAQKQRFTATIAMGDLKFNPRRFEAREVYAGSSVPGGDKDAVEGSVIARDGNQLTVRGTTLLRANGHVRFNKEIVVTIGRDTQVRKQLSTDTFDIGAISVGQRLRIFGDIIPSITLITALDASQGFVHMQLTSVSGTVAGTSGLTMDLNAISHRRVGVYDFAGTGVSADHDADPSNYEVDTNTLNISTLQLNDLLRVRGFPTPFGTAPADFDAQTLIAVKMLPAIMVVDWQPASAGAISRLDNNGMALNLDDVGRFHHVSQSGVRTDLVSLATEPTIKPGVEGESHYIIEQSERYKLYPSFENFVTDLQRRLDGGAMVRRIVAPGSYDNGDGILTAKRLLVVLE